MVKRKAEGNPHIEPESELGTPECTRPEDLAISEHDPTTESTTGVEHREETPGCHLDPASTELDEGSELGDSPFWAMLALVGYEIW